MDLSILQRLYRMRQEREDEKNDEVRQKGRPQGEFLQALGREAMSQGRPWPVVMEDPQLQTTTVPATYEGLLAFVASWDSLLLDEELEALKAVVGKLVPMGLIYQKTERARRAQEKKVLEHIRINDPERWDRMNGWKV